VSHSASLRVNISKRKTGKKKADKQRGHREKLKGNGIIGGYLLGRKPFMP